MFYQNHKVIFEHSTTVFDVISALCAYKVMRKFKLKKNIKFSLKQNLKLKLKI